MAGGSCKHTAASEWSFASPPPRTTRMSSNYLTSFGQTAISTNVVNTGVLANMLAQVRPEFRYKGNISPENRLEEELSDKMPLNDMCISDWKRRHTGTAAKAQSTSQREDHRAARQPHSVTLKDPVVTEAPANRHSGRFLVTLIPGSHRPLCRTGRHPCRTHSGTEKHRASAALQGDARTDEETHERRCV